ncbi:MAG: nucleoside hydrolase [Anaerolineae bacterium]|nr:nucleoside hydrolase [Anaerolineae bacterium]
MAIPFLVDTDCAFDDWLALAYLIQCPQVDLKAVTIAATGEAHVGAGVDTALRILQLRDMNTPVSSGRTSPLKGNHRFPLFVRLAMDTRLGVGLPKAKRSRSPQNSQALLTDVIRRSPEKVTLLTLAPLTNIAEVLAASPELADKIEMIYMMGGALNVPGNLAEMLPGTKNRFAEWNIYVDYYAADVILRSGAPVTLIPLDATNQVPLTTSFYTRLVYQPQTPAADFVMRVVKRLKMLSGQRTLTLWDLVAAAIATHPEIAQFETRQLRVEQADGVTIGRVVEDKSCRPVRVCTAVDQTAVELIVLNTLNGYVSDRVPVQEDYQSTS